MVDYSKNSGMPYKWREKQWCPERFDNWWNMDLFKWQWSFILPEHYPDKFEIWWNSKLFNWDHAEYLKEHCAKYKHIWQHDYVLHELER